MTELIEILHREDCSLVLRDAQGHVRTFFKQGVRDLEDLLDHEPETLRGAAVADKVVGKAAAAMMAHGGVREVYGEVMSRKALPMLEQGGIAFSWGELIDAVVIPEGDARCPLETIVGPAGTLGQAVSLLREHWAEMRRKNEKSS